jgi:ferredoxin-NADP reductase/phenylpropionate dioxygenase-like ring-hydroxylating dioxygenase large terminal subunit
MFEVKESFDELTAAVDRGESLPVAWYTDPAFTELELQKIFRNTWQYVGPLCELANVGDFISGFAGNVPVAVVRDETGLNGFVNVCRHRRHQVMKGRGNANMLQCGYHAWTYDLTGCLRGVPRSQHEPNFNLEDYPLLRARAEALGPWVFVNLNPNAHPISYYFGDVLGMIAQSGLDLDSLQHWQREEWEARANWKTMVENFLECYHCAVAHPSFSAAIDVRPENYALTTYDWMLSQVGNVRESALEGKSLVKIYDVRGALVEAQYHFLWPNFTVSINPGVPNLSIDVWYPHGPNAARGFSEHYFGPGVTRQKAEEMIAFNAEVGDEDDELTNSVQLGLISGLPETGRFLTQAEHLAVDFMKLVVGAMTGEHDRLHDGTSPDRHAYTEFEVVKVEPESEEITSYYLRRTDGEAIAPWVAGQFLPIRLNGPDWQKPVLRTYTISTAPNKEHYRLSIKRMGEGAISSEFFHTNVRVGSRIEAMAPRGKFVLDPASDRPIVLVSGGVGVTPMLAFMEALLEKARASEAPRPIAFIHGARNGRVHAFGDQIRAAAAEHPALKVHVCLSQPRDDDALGVTYDSAGHVNADLVTELVDPINCDVYLCGPPAFMQSLYDGLIDSGVPSDRIHFESFGTASVRIPEPHTAVHVAGSEGLAIPVRFAKSGVDATWTQDAGTLLELAEDNGLAPLFGCRSGSCGSCTTRVTFGSVEYVQAPLAPCGNDEVLLCSSVPRSSRNPDGEELGMVLDV